MSATRNWPPASPDALLFRNHLEPDSLQMFPYPPSPSSAPVPQGPLGIFPCVPRQMHPPQNTCFLK